MIPITKKIYKHGEIRIGWASWDKGEYKSKSIKWAYKNRSNKISRGAPEVPFDVLIEMVMFSLKEGALTVEQIKQLKYAI